MNTILANLMPPGLTPHVRLHINGQPLGSQTQQRLISLSLIDKRGFAADELTLELSDHDGLMAPPQIGHELELWLGYQETGLIYKGRYTISEHSHSGAPDKITLTAHSADLAASLTEQTDRSWHNTTVHAIATELAEKHGYTPTVAADYQQESIDHLDQTSESDASFLTRLAETVDATTSIKNDHLLFMPIAQGQTASGLPLPLAIITRQDGDSHNYTETSSDAYQAVRAYYTVPGTGQKKAVVVHKDPTANAQDATAKTKTLRHLHPSEAKARQAADTTLAQLARSTATFSINLAQGRPELLPEMPVQVLGFKDMIDIQQWLIDEISHQVDDGGYVGVVKLERVRVL